MALRRARWEGSGAETPAQRAAQRLAASARAAIERLVSREIPAEVLERAARVVERFARRAEAYPPRDPRGGKGPERLARSDDYHDWSPVIGVSSPLAPPLRMREEGGVVRGEVTFGAAHEGPAGLVHGGWIAAVFDELLAYAQATGGRMGMTSRLTVRYRRPVPSGVALSLEGEVVRIEGREIHTAGRLLAEGELRAEAEAVFLRLRRDDPPG